MSESTGHKKFRFHYVLAHVCDAHITYYFASTNHSTMLVLIITCNFDSGDWGMHCPPMQIPRMIQEAHDFTETLQYIELYNYLMCLGGFLPDGPGFTATPPSGMFTVVTDS